MFVIYNFCVEGKYSIKFGKFGVKIDVVGVCVFNIGLIVKYDGEYWVDLYGKVWD